MFSKSKTNIDEDKQENFRLEVVRKGLVFAAIRYAVLKFTYHLCLSCAIETVKLRISLFLLLVNLIFPGGHFFGRDSLPTSDQHKKLKLVFFGTFFRTSPIIFGW